MIKMYEDGIRVKAQSRADIAFKALSTRRAFGHDDYALYFPLMEFFEHGLQELDPQFYYDIREDGSLEGGARALTYPDKHLILVEASVYDGACKGIGKDRMTIAHEVGHMVLHPGVPLARNYNICDLKLFENSEWQADVFAGELLAPIRLIGNMTAIQIIDECKVSRKAAEVQRDKALKKLRRTQTSCNLF